MLFRHLRLDSREIVVGQRPFGMKPEGRPHDLADGGADFESPQVARGIAAYGDDAPDFVLDRPHDRFARVAELGILEVAVAVDDHARIRIRQSPYGRSTTWERRCDRG